MSKTEKLIARLLNERTAFTWQELETLLRPLGYQPLDGRGSRIKFHNGDPRTMSNLHRPHPGNELPTPRARSSSSYAQEDSSNG